MYYKNALIRLLNSGAIDVDKLDYIKRDSIVSGYDSIAIDTHRLLNSLTAVPLIDEEDGAFTLAFGKSALSVVQNVVDCRNMLYTWTYGHHKVVYESDYLLKKAVTKIIESDKEKLPELFSIDAIKTRLCCDDDIWVFLKKYPDIPEVAELLDRSRHRIALWKSRVEFDLLFPRNEKTIAVGNFDVSLMIREIKAWDAGDAGRKAYESFCEYVDTEYAVKGASNVAVFISPKTKAKIIMPNDVYIEIGGELYRYTSLEAVAEKLRDSVFAYVYISENSLKIRYKRRLRSNKYEFTKCFVEYIKKYQKFCLQPDFSR
jgi:HD superfamily phosphohydrolase